MKSKIGRYLLSLVVIISLLPRVLVAASPEPAMDNGSLGVPQAGDKIVASYDYTYYASGNVNTIKTNNGHGIEQTQTFTYDAANRLASAKAETTMGSPAGQGDYSLRNYQYDSTGRLVNGDDTAMEYDNANPKPYHAVDRITSGDTHYTYDGAGNLSTKTVNTPSVQTTTYSYDPENRMTQVVTPTLTAKFYYDGDGQLIKKVVGSKTIVYIGGYFEYTEDNGTATGTQKYYHFGSQRVAMQANDDPVKYMFTDQVGSTTLILDSRTESEIRDEARYKPFGELRYQMMSNGTSLPTDLLYTGQRKVDDVGLYYYNARWVDVYLKRF